jgi:hypothetical protein
MNFKISAPSSADSMVCPALGFAELSKPLRHSMPLDRASAAVRLKSRPFHERIHALFD